MKLGSGLIGIIIAGILGYVLEPSIRPALLPSKKRSGDPVAEKGSQPAPPPAQPQPKAPAVQPPQVAAVPAWVTSLKPEQLPEKVTLKAKAVIPVSGSAEPMVLPAGVPVTPVRIEGSYLVISPFGGPMEGKVPIVSTDLVALLGNKPPAAVPAAPPVVANNPPPAEPKPEPEPEPEPEPAKRLTDEEIVSIMQKSVKDGQIKEFTFEQVLGWKAAEDKDSDGESYQSGLASYKAETIFGVKNIQAQALIKDGKVIKWIWPKSGMEIN